MRAVRSNSGIIKIMNNDDTPNKDRTTYIPERFVAWEKMPIWNQQLVKRIADKLRKEGEIKSCQKPSHD